MSNLRLAFRTLMKAPLVTGVAVVSLALGIGANTAIFSLFDQLLRRPLPVAAPGELVNLSAPGPKPGSNSCNQQGDCAEVFSYSMFRDLEKDGSVASLAASRLMGMNLSFRNETISGEGALVSGSYFPALGLKPAVGRLLGPNDDGILGESPVAVLSYDYWKTHAGLSPSVISDRIIVNGQTLTIVGVAPEGFQGGTLGSRPQVFVPITLRGALEPVFALVKGFENRRNYWVYIFGRLKPGVTSARAASVLNAKYRGIVNAVDAPLQKGMSDKTMERFKAKELVLASGARGQSRMDREARTPIMLLFVVTGVVLVIACANVANLLLARSAGRTGEMAVRLSIGAGRGQLIGQLLLESCLLALMGGGAGLLAAKATLAFIVSLLPPDAGSSMPFTLDWPILLFAGVLSIATGVVFGLFPALHSTRLDLAQAFRGVSGQPSGSRSASWFRRSLVTVQITLAMTLLGCAGLFIKSLVNVSRVDLGIKIDNVVTFGVSPQLNGYSPERSRALFARIEQELAATPGVSAVGASALPLLAGNNWGTGVSVQGFQGGPDVDQGASLNEIGPGYFGAMGIPLLAGREFSEADVLGSPKVAIVNEAFAAKFNLGRDAVGKWMSDKTGTDAKLDMEIVGLTKNAKYSEVRDAVPPQLFRPYRQDENIGSLVFYARTNLEPTAFLATLPGLVKRLDPNLPIENLRTLPQQVRENVFLDRMLSTLAISFAVLATLLASIGLYGVLAYTVAQRTREFGLRMALGANPSRVRRLVMRQVVWMTVIGGALGVGAALAVGQFARSLLFEIGTTEPLVLAVAVGLLATVALSAGLIPAFRASRIDPMRALRYE